ncbi:protein of unknown function [Belliella buryatensis]|uniref:DUF4271 domain-containing protein n=1 Tax=Belliella buryatensis TaxID=1500549 RepID=A0A239BL06_9BACT|nr:DUF4271 domain-containing protein [Belliella buryatensis]SNS08887.1 protein of unknown function [Belliella buryatensis]
MCWSLAAQAQVLENYQNDLAFAKQEGWFKSSEMIQATLDVSLFPTSSFQFEFPEGATVFIDDILWFFASQDTLTTIELSDLKSKFGLEGKSSVLISVLNKGIQTSDVSIRKGYFGENTNYSIVVKTETGIEEREISRFYDFFFISLVLILLLVGLYKLIYPLVLYYIIDPQSLLTAEDFSETNALQKFFSLDVIFYVIIINLLSSLIVMVGIKVFDFALLKPMVSSGLNGLFFYWLVLTLILFGVTILKFLFIKFMTFVYDLGKNEFSHFFYLLRIVSILLVVITLLIAVFALNRPENLNTIMTYAFTVFFWAYIAGVFFLMLIMMKRMSFNNYHLFAYICTAELVPFLIISKFIMG